ncbi:MAG: diaminopimelate epimerase, partial [Actinomycetota bacterium]
MPSRIEFSKWQGLGNDYVIIAVPNLDFTLGPAQARMICDRHLGIGADGVLLWSGSAADAFQLEIFNPDGSRAEMCGNGIRMLARHLHQTGRTDSAEMLVETEAGPIRPRVREDGLVEVNMGRARLGGDGIAGFDGEPGGGEAVGQKLEAGGSEFEYTFVSMGNPHCVIEAGEPGEVELDKLGPVIERHEL